MSTPTPREVFRRLVEGVSRGDVDGLVDLYADDASVAHPFAANGAARLQGREQLREHFGSMSGSPLEFTPHEIAVHETSDPEVIVAEFEYRGAVRDSGQRFAVPCIFVLRVRDGRIVESRDYINPLSFPKITGRLQELVDQVSEH